MIDYKLEIAYALDETVIDDLWTADGFISSVIGQQPEGGGGGFGNRDIGFVFSKNRDRLVAIDTIRDNIDWFYNVGIVIIRIVSWNYNGIRNYNHTLWFGEHDFAPEIRVRDAR